MQETLAERAGEIARAYAGELARPGPRREDYRLREEEDDTMADGWRRLDPRRVLAISRRQQEAGQRASWFYDQLRNLTADDPPSRQAVLNELAYLDDETGQQPTPASLPQTALWVASGWQRDIAAAELPVIAREILSTPSRRHSH